MSIYTDVDLHIPDAHFDRAAQRLGHLLTDACYPATDAPDGCSRVCSYEGTEPDPERHPVAIELIQARIPFRWTVTHEYEAQPVHYRYDGGDAARARRCPPPSRLAQADAERIATMLDPCGDLAHAIDASPLLPGLEALGISTGQLVEALEGMDASCSTCHEELGYCRCTDEDVAETGAEATPEPLPGSFLRDWLAEIGLDDRQIQGLTGLLGSLCLGCVQDIARCRCAERDTDQPVRLPDEELF